MYYIELIDYCKKIKSTPVLTDINLEIEKGSVVGLYGRNASGKTMLLRAIAGLIIPSSGVVKVEGG